MLTVKRRVQIWKNRSIITKEGCWRYIVARERPQAKWNGHIIYLSRISAHIFLGLDLSSSKQVNHKRICHHVDCWNPDHLYIGTQRENINDSIEMKTWRYWGRLGPRK